MASFDCLTLQYTWKYCCGYSWEYASLFVYVILEWCNRCGKYCICMKLCRFESLFQKTVTERNILIVFNLFNYAHAFKNNIYIMFLHPDLHICINISSSSYRAGSTDIPDPLSPLLPIVHRPRQVFRTTTCILT